MKARRNSGNMETMAATTIHLLRHGEVHNPEGILYGRLPGYHLSERGFEMAERVGAVLSGQHEVREIVSSPLLRARQTAEPLARLTGLEPTIDHRVIEAENDFQGQKVSKDRLLRSPAMLAKTWNPFLPSWGEPYHKQVLRMKAAVTSLRRRVDGGVGVVVSHQLPIWVTRLHAENRHLWHDPRSRECSLASLTTLTFDGHRLVDLSYAEPCRDLLPEKAVPGA